MDEIVTPTASVVIPTHNAADTVAEQLDAVAASVAATSFEVEIIVVDNRSSDDSGAVAEAWSESTGVALRVLRADDMGSEPYARNVGWRAARAPLVLYCDADDMVGRGWVEGLVAALGASAYATGPIDMHTLNPAWLANVRGASVSTGMSYLVEGVPYAHGCNMGFRRDVLESVGGFDVAYTAGCDLDIAIRLWEDGHELTFDERASVSYRLRPTLRATAAQGRFYGRYRIPIMGRLGDHVDERVERRRYRRRWLWLARKTPRAVVSRETRARWVWVAAQLSGEAQGRRDVRRKEDGA